MLGTALALFATFALAADFGPQPKGIMLNLDFQQIKDGLIPSKTLYPLVVPQGELTTELASGRTVLMMQPGQHLDIPHSLLLDPDGSEWIASIRVFVLSDGIVLSQGDNKTGYAIYIKDGAVHAAVRTGQSAVLLEEPMENGITDYTNKWVTIELRISAEMASLKLNRARVSIVPLQAPLKGSDQWIRIGTHDTLPLALRYNPDATTDGFSGAIASVKLIRQ
jgi:hypothetical protein